MTILSLVSAVGCVVAIGVVAFMLYRRQRAATALRRTQSCRGKTVAECDAMLGGSYRYAFVSPGQEHVVESDTEKMDFYVMVDKNGIVEGTIWANMYP